MKIWIIFILATIYSTNVSARDQLFFSLIDSQIKMLHERNVDTLIVYGLNNFQNHKTIDNRQSFKILYQKKGRYYRKVIVYKKKEGKAKIINDYTDSSNSYSVIFDYIKNDYQNVIQQVDTIRNLEIQYSIVNGKVAKTSTSEGYYMGILYYLGIYIGDKLYSDNIPVYGNKDDFNAFYKLQNSYWTLYSMLNNIR